MGERKEHESVIALLKEESILTLETSCIVEITPIIDIIDIKIEGLSEDPITIKNLEKNKILILHGIDGTITVDGINKFSDADLWEFPRLKPGSNNIKVSTNDCIIKIKYKNRYFYKLIVNLWNFIIILVILII